MPDIHRVLSEIAAEEEAFQTTQFLAPCVRGGRVRARVAGLVQTFAPKPREFEGWGIFRPVSVKLAEVVEEASLPLVAEYLRLLAPLRLRLAHALKGHQWLAYPVNESDMRQRHRIGPPRRRRFCAEEGVRRWGGARPVAVHLVTEGAAFDPIVARWDGTAWWFEEVDRRADPLAGEQLKEALRQVTPPTALRFTGLTPEMRATYELAARQTAARVPAKRAEAMLRSRGDEGRLREALRLGGGELREFRDRGEFWLVEWSTADGERHSSAIAKSDLTVMSAGICLSDRDRDFDLHSLVGVIEGQWE